MFCLFCTYEIADVLINEPEMLPPIFFRNSLKMNHGFSSLKDSILSYSELVSAVISQTVSISKCSYNQVCPWISFSSLILCLVDVHNIDICYFIFGYNTYSETVRFLIQYIVKHLYHVVESLILFEVHNPMRLNQIDGWTYAKMLEMW